MMGLELFNTMILLLLVVAAIVGTIVISLYLPMLDIPKFRDLMSCYSRGQTQRTRNR